MSVAGKIPIRFWIACMVFLTTYINYTTRVNISISIVSMTMGKSKVTPECVRLEMEATSTVGPTAVAGAETTSKPYDLPDVSGLHQLLFYIFHMCMFSSMALGTNGTKTYKAL